MSDNDIIIELPVDRLEWEMANDRQKRIILRDCLRDAFLMALDACKERGRRPAAMKGRPEIPIPIENTGIILDPTADAAAIVGFRQRFATTELPREERDG